MEGLGNPVAFVLTPGQQHEARAFERLVDRGAVKRQGAGRPGIGPDRVCGGKGYSSRKARDSLHYPPKEERTAERPLCDHLLYRKRNLVERTINRLKQFRRIATRYEKEGENHLAMLHIGSILLWI